MKNASREPVLLEHVRVVRVGHGANCSSIGSVVDTLFVGALVGSALFAAIAAALASEPVKIAGAEREADKGDRATREAGEP